MWHGALRTLHLRAVHCGCPRSCPRSCPALWLTPLLPRLHTPPHLIIPRLVTQKEERPIHLSIYISRTQPHKALASRAIPFVILPTICFAEAHRRPVGAAAFTQQLVVRRAPSQERESERERAHQDAPPAENADGSTKHHRLSGRRQRRRRRRRRRPRRSNRHHHHQHHQRSLACCRRIIINNGINSRQDAPGAPAGLADARPRAA